MSRFSLAILLILATASAILSGDGAEPRALLKKAIAAHGGEKYLRKPRAGIAKTISKIAEDTEIHMEEVFDLPKRWKRTTVGTFEGEKKIS